MFDTSSPLNLVNSGEKKDLEEIIIFCDQKEYNRSTVAGIIRILTRNYHVILSDLYLFDF